MLVGLLLLLHVARAGRDGFAQAAVPARPPDQSNSNRSAPTTTTAVTPDLHMHLALGRGFGSYDGLKYRILDNQYLGLLVMVGLSGRPPI